MLTIAAPGVLANDSDVVEGSDLNVSAYTQPGHGSVTLAADGSFIYTPEANYNGVDSFYYTVNDGTDDGNTVKVSIDVTPVNDVPVAVADSYTTAEDTVLTIAAPGVLANDSDVVEGSDLNVSAYTQPGHGSVTLAADGSFIYTPEANYNGVDSFYYTVNDGTDDGNTVKVSIDVTPVNDVPVAVADSYTTAEDTVLTIAAPGVLANDSDVVEGSDLNVSAYTQPGHGSVTLAADGSFIYTPEANYNGVDSFYYTVNDGTDDGNTVKVSIDVTPVNDVPVANADSYTTAEDTVLTIAAPGVLANDSDVVEGSDLNVSAYTQPGHGSVTLAADGSFIYTPEANYNGVDSFYYTVNDGTDDGNTVKVSIDVTPVNDVPVANADSYTTAEDTVLTIAAPGVLANDSDVVEGSDLNVSAYTQPGHGSVTLAADGSFIYTPEANYNGVDSFYYTVNDGTDDGNTVKVSIDVTPVNDVPVANADSYTTAEDTVLTIAAPGVLANDSDVVEGSDLNVSAYTQPGHGSVTLAADGSFIYTPEANYNGVDSFYYTVNDGTDDGNTVKVSIDVTPVNDVPVANG